MTDYGPKPTTHKSCATCCLGVRVDTGYSNYTVEGTDFHCAAHLHPNAPFDEWYEVDWRLWYGAWCSSHIQGEPLHIDVDRDALEELTPEQREVWEQLGLEEGQL